MYTSKSYNYAMKCLNKFMIKYDIVDEKMGEYSNNLVKKISKIINGRIDIMYKNDTLANYAGLYFEYEKNDVINAEKYYLMAFGNSNAMNNLAVMYENQNNMKDSKKYYLMSIKYNNVDAMYNLADLCVNENNMNDAKKYLIMAMTNGHKKSMEILQNLLDPLQVYIIVNDIENKNNDHIILISELKKNKNVRNYLNKINNNYKFGNCMICYDDNVKLIPLDCTHFYCCVCYQYVLNNCALKCDKN